MSDSAVLPKVGYRQWVLSFPGPLAVRLGYDAPLLAALAERLARAVMQDAGHAAQREAAARPGALKRFEVGIWARG